MSKLRHPFIIGLNYAFQTSTQLFYVMDFARGGEVCLFTFCPNHVVLFTNKQLDVFRSSTGWPLVERFQIKRRDSTRAKSFAPWSSFTTTTLVRTRTGSEWHWQYIYRLFLQSTETWNQTTSWSTRRAMWNWQTLVWARSWPMKRIGWTRSMTVQPETEAAEVVVRAVAITEPLPDLKAIRALTKTWPIGPGCQPAPVVVLW